jgi:hypothetical protein
MELAEEESPRSVARLKLVEASSSKIWEPVGSQPGSTPTTSQVLNEQRQQPAELPSDVEAALLHTLTRPRAESEGHHLGAIRREQELAAIIMELDATAAFQLNRRLDMNRDCDPIAVAFRRLLAERRQRLRVVLDQRRRMLAARGAR